MIQRLRRQLTLRFSALQGKLSILNGVPGCEQEFLIIVKIKRIVQLIVMPVKLEQLKTEIKKQSFIYFPSLATYYILSFYANLLQF